MRKPASLCPEATLKSTIHPLEAKHGQIQMRNMFQRKSFGFHHVTIRISDDLKLQSCGAAGVAIVLSAAPKSSLFPWDDRDWKDAVFFHKHHPIEAVGNQCYITCLFYLSSFYLICLYNLYMIIILYSIYTQYVLCECFTRFPQPDLWVQWSHQDRQGRRIEAETPRQGAIEGEGRSPRYPSRYPGRGNKWGTILSVVHRVFFPANPSGLSGTKDTIEVKWCWMMPF